MEPSIVYALVVSGLLFLFILRGNSNLAAAVLCSRQVVTFLCTHVYLPLYRRQRFLQPVSRLGAALQLLYWAITISFNFIGVSSLSEGGSRAGSLAIFSFIPLFLADRLGFTADIMNLPLRIALQVHKSVGVMAILQSAAHITLKCLSGEFTLHSRVVDQNFYGIMAAAALALLALLTLPFPRKFLYELFLKSHYALVSLASYSLWQHVRTEKFFNRDRIFLLSSIGVFACLNATQIIAILYRNTLKRRSWTTARVVQFTGAAEYIISLPRPCKVGPGQYFRLWTPAAGFFSFFQSHPFSIASWSEDENREVATVSLLVKAQYGLSRHLAAKSPGESFIVALDGPYGQSVDTSRYGTLVLFATGIGMATQMSVLKRAYNDYQLGKNILRRISIVWQMDSEIEQAWVKPWMDQFVEADRQRKMLRISLYVVHDFVDPANKLSDRVPYGSGVRINKLYGKADLNEVMAFEMQERVGKVLVTVSAEDYFRDKVRSLALALSDQKVDYQELDFQPVISSGFWSRKKPRVDYEGVIRGKDAEKVDYQELDFQPVISSGFWSRKKPQVDYEGVIRGKDVEKLGS